MREEETDDESLYENFDAKLGFIKRAPVVHRSAVSLLEKQKYFNIKEDLIFCKDKMHHKQGVYIYQICCTQ